MRQRSAYRNRAKRGTRRAVLVGSPDSHPSLTRLLARPSARSASPEVHQARPPRLWPQSVLAPDEGDGQPLLQTFPSNTHLPLATQSPLLSPLDRVLPLLRPLSPCTEAPATATMAPSYSTASSDRVPNEKADAQKKEDLPTGVVQMRVDGRSDDEEAQDIEEVDGVFGAQGAEPGQVNYRRFVSTLPVSLRPDGASAPEVLKNFSSSCSVGWVSTSILLMKSQIGLGTYAFPQSCLRSRRTRSSRKAQPVTGIV